MDYLAGKLLTYTGKWDTFREVVKFYT